ncbi:protein kinase [Candidatus Uabimicrobium sp. HlEnr_7]|uniref:serine/threonine-protein kinase n=1 Tax=Candidatus Uabimicrobium helgolandensis TaxID=3095367 RepID=UPI00355625BC
MVKTWFIKSSKDRKIFGPYSQEILQQYIQQNKIDCSEYEISDDGNTWRDFSTTHISVPVRKKSPTQMLGKYRIIKELGRGGMGIVFQVEDTQLQRKCAVKILLPEIRESLDAVQRFQREAKAVAQIQHPSIIQIYDICQTPQHFFAMAYVEGVNLQRYIVGKTMQQKLQVFRQICHAIEFAHNKNIIHRDLKPDNIIVDSNGVPVVLDFGIAKYIGESTDLTKTGNIFGTPKYMSPEAAKAQKTDHRSDIYSLGVILYEILTGTVPFTGENPIELLFHLTTSDPIAPSRLNVSIAKDSDLEVVCLKALAKDPQKRIANASFFHSEIDSIIHKRPIQLKPPTSWQKFSKWCKRNPVPFAIAIIAFAMAVAIFVVQKDVKKAQTEIARVKKNAIDSTLETLNAGLTAQNIFTNYRKIKLCYSYLKEILEDIDASKAKETYRKLNMHLKFNILSKFPKMLEKKMPESDYPASCSPQNKYIAKMYNKNSTLYIWRNDTKLSFTKNNAFLKIEKLRNHKIVFSPDNKYLVYESPGQNRIVFFDIIEKQAKFSHVNSRVDNIHFSSDSRYCVFRSWVEKGGEIEKVCNLVDLRNFKIRTFITKKYSSMVISPQTKWLVIQDKKQSRLIIHDIPQNKTEYYGEEIFRHDCPMFFTKEKNKLFFISFFTIGVFDLETRKITSSPSISVGHQKNTPLIETSSSYIAIGQKNGGVVLARPKKDFIAQESMSNYSDILVSELAFERAAFLAVTKRKTIELRDIYTKNITYIFSENERVQQLQLQLFSEQGLKISFVKKNSYKEYILPFTKLKIAESIKNILEKSKKITSDLDITHTMILDKNLFVYGGKLGFIKWMDGVSELKHFWVEVTGIHYNRKLKQIFLRFQKGSKVKFCNLSNIQDIRRYEHGFKEKDIKDFVFSQDKEHLYFFAESPERLVKQNLRTKRSELITKTAHPIKILLELENDTLVIVSQGGDINTCEVYVVKPGNQKIRILKNSNLDQITSLATDKAQNFFAAGDKNGNIVLWEDIFSPKLLRKIKVSSEITNLFFSPKNDYLVVVAKDNSYVYDLKDLNNRFEIYRGFYKKKGIVLADDWSKVYIPDGAGEIMIFDQTFWVDKGALYQKILECDEIVQAMTGQKKGLLQDIKTIESALVNAK